MNILKTTSGCSEDLLRSIQNARCFSDAFETFRPLSYSSECQVTIARCKFGGQQVVVKTYSKHGLGPLAMLQVRTEIDITHELASPHVVQLLIAFEDSRSLYLVLQYADGGDMRTHMRRAHSMGEQRVREFIAQPLLQALLLLQQEGIVHRDLKPENVLVHQNQTLLADFGLAMYFSMPPPDATKAQTGGPMDRALACLKLANNAGGTALYTAPEVLLAMFKSQPQQLVVQHKNDIWALGIMMVEALTGQHPFSPENCARYNGNVMYSIAYHRTVELPNKISAELRDFLSLVLQRDPQLRPTARELVQHPWICGKALGKDMYLPRTESACAVESGAADTPTSDSDEASDGHNDHLDTLHEDRGLEGPDVAARLRQHSEEHPRLESPRCAFQMLDCWAD